MTARGIVSVLLLFTASSLPAWAQIGVSPPKVDVVIGSKPTTESVRIFNFGTEPTEVAVSVYNWELDESNDVRILPPSEQSLDQWIIINPLHFTVEPGESQVVRFSARPRVEPEPGEHRAIIYFDEVVPKVPENSEVQLFFRLGVAVYGYVGEVARVGSLNDVAAGTSSAEFDLTSHGTAHVRFDGQFAIWPADRYPGTEKTFLITEVEGADIPTPEGAIFMGGLPATPVLPGTRRKLKLQFAEALPPGDYVLDLNGKLGGAPIDRGVRFTVQGDESIAGVTEP